MATLLYAYAAGALVMAVILGVYMAARTDRLDWQHGTLDIVVSFVMSVVLWPLLLLKPKLLFNPGKLIDRGSATMARATLERDAHIRSFGDDPPRCGQVIRYRQGGDCVGEFLLPAEGIEQFITEIPSTIRDVDFEMINQSLWPAILSWVRNRDRSAIESTDAPEIINNHLRYIAFELAERGQANVRCLKCNISVNPDQQIVTRKTGRGIHKSIDCSKGHRLLEDEIIAI